jgi:hypothetical protein
MVYLNEPTKKEIVNHQHEIIWHVWKEKQVVRMESHLFMSIIVVRSSTKTFVVLRTKESTFTCHFGSVQINVWPPSLKAMIVVLNMEHFSK